MEGMFSGKVAIVTGGASGIGEAAARLLAHQGAAVAIGDISAAGAEVAESIRGAGGNALFVETDVTDEASVSRLVRRTVESLGRLDVAFNNAGTDGDYSTAATCTTREWDRVVDLNMKAVWLCMKHEIPEMLKGGGGSIVNTASRNAEVASRNMFTYISTKHGVLGMTRSAAMDYSASGIRVNALLPGPVDTPMLRSAFAGSGLPEPDIWAKGTVPMGRVSTPFEQAEAALWLLSDRASYITGIGLPVDGGLACSV